jgi:hypothetical protein
MNQGQSSVRLIGSLAAALAVILAPHRPAAAAEPPAESFVPACDRACLYAQLDRYLAALQAHDPRQAPIAPDARFTENNVALEVGDGLWGTISARGDYDLRFADTLAGTVGFYGVIDEGGVRSPIALRLTVRNGLIAEIESVVVRPQDAAVPFLTADIASKPILNERLPPARRTPRDRMVAAAMGYFDTLQRNDGTLHAQFTPDCSRREDGYQTTNNPEGARQFKASIMALGCEGQFRTGWYRYDTRLRGRRVLAVDEERGLVMMAAFIDHDGRLGDYLLSDGTKATSKFRRPHTYCLMETFKIRDGKIEQVEAVFTNTPYRMPSPWGGS